MFATISAIITFIAVCSLLDNHSDNYFLTTISMEYKNYIAGNAWEIIADELILLFQQLRVLLVGNETDDHHIHIVIRQALQFAE